MKRQATGIVLALFLGGAVFACRHRLREDVPRIWAHRGYHATCQENSLEAFAAAIERGARGIELDIFYDRELSRFVVSHGYPYRTINGKLLFLDEVFATLGRKVSYWLDYKNLSEKNAAPSRALLLKLLTENRLLATAYVEHGNAPLLEEFAGSGILTLRTLPELSTIPETRLKSLKEYFKRSRHAGIAIPYSSADISSSLAFLNTPAYVFTINDEETLNRYMNMPLVKVILTDKAFYTKRGRR